ncbi:MAG: hypothetical protein HYV52_01700 [Parcubacteria group bacterium]|nr:hypothetical protein [Parcubacteria group bacterium]
MGMEKSKKLTMMSIKIGGLGIIAWAIGGILQWTGGSLWVPYWHWWADGAFLMLAAIWLKLGAIYHWHIEKEK